MEGCCECGNEPSGSIKCELICIVYNWQSKCELFD